MQGVLVTMLRVGRTQGRQGDHSFSLRVLSCCGWLEQAVSMSRCGRERSGREGQSREVNTSKIVLYKPYPLISSVRHYRGRACELATIACFNSKACRLNCVLLRLSWHHVTQLGERSLAAHSWHVVFACADTYEACLSSKTGLSATLFHP